MIKNLKNILIVSFFLVSCKTSEPDFPSISQEDLKAIEVQDHQQCVSKGLEYGELGDVITELYWRCRYSLLMDRKISYAFTSKSIGHNATIDQMSEEVLKNIDRSKYAILEKVVDGIDLSDHNKCVAMGYDLSFKKNEDGYYRCRQNLVDLRTSKSPKETNIYESVLLPKDQNKTLQITIESRHINQEATRVADLMQKYPDCIGMKVDSADFKRCSDAKDRSEICIGKINSEKIKRELDDKIYCQEQAFTQFPDNYALAKDKSSSEIEKLESEAKKIKDQEVKNEINATLLYLEGSKTVGENIGRGISDSRDDEKKSKEKLYNRVELLKLREHFIYRCNQKMEDKLPDFVSKFTEECLDIAKNWDKD